MSNQSQSLSDEWKILTWLMTKIKNNFYVNLDATCTADMD